MKNSVDRLVATVSYSKIQKSGMCEMYLKAILLYFLSCTLSCTGVISLRYPRARTFSTDLGQELVLNIEK